MRLGEGIKHITKVKKFNELPSILQRVHGNKYDYSKVVYTGIKDKIIIICPVHGEYTTTMDMHIQGKNCPMCVGGVRQTLEEFITKAKVTHGDRYDYSKVNYINNSTKVKIICPEHGEFLQSPALHQNGSGCPKCSGKIITNTTEFIAFGKNKFKDLHTYDKAVFTKSLDKIIVTCGTHGDFITSPNAYQNSVYGCPNCSNVAEVKLPVLLERFKEKHQEKYCYSDVVYRTMHTKVSIMCRSCSSKFLQTPRNHLNGNGCPHCCKMGGFDQTKRGILYYLSINDGEAYKIGITNRSIKERFSKDDFKKIKVVKEWCYLLGRDAAVKELEILHKYSKHKYTRSHLLSSGNTELFSFDVLGIDTTGE